MLCTLCVCCVCRYLDYGEPEWKEIVKEVLKGVRT